MRLSRESGPSKVNYPSSQPGVSTPSRQNQDSARRDKGHGLFSRRAFTLIELLVVIAIVTLLIAIFLPGLRLTRRQTRAVLCQANLRQWGAVFALYTEDNERRFPGDGDSTLWILSGRYVSITNPDEPGEFHFIETKGIARCPMAVRRSDRKGTFTSPHTVATPTSSVTWQLVGKYGSTFTAWEISSVSPPFRCSYGLNRALFPSRPYYPERSPFHGKYYPYLFSIKGAAGIPVLADSVSPTGDPRDDATFGRPPLTDSGKNTGYWPFCINRHDGSVNGLFLDWSVRKIGLKELWTLRWSPGFDTAGPWTTAGGVQPGDWPVWMRGFKDY